MIYYSTPRGVFAIEPDGSQDYLIEPDWMPMTGAEVDAHVNPTLTREQNMQVVQNQIEALERQHIAPRWQREFSLGVMQSMATPEQLAANYGYQAVKALDDQIVALRAQLEAM